MAEISNKFLAVLVVLAIGLTSVSTLTLLNRLNQFGPEPVSGRATTGYGQVNLSVQQSLSIVMVNALIDFGTGYVNTTPSCSVANLSIEQTTYLDEDDCWVTTTPPPTSALEIENNGNVNVTLSVTGPSEIDFFNTYAATCSGLPGGCLLYNLTWKVSDPNNACPNGDEQATYTNFGGTNKPVCGSGNFNVGPDATDSLYVDVRVNLPVNLQTGVYENTTIEFEAT